jgi:hypothetical protein
MNSRILPHETEIVGGWFLDGTQMKADAAAQRIESLIDGHLVEVGRPPDGWSVLYKDPDDNRYWQLTYPNSSLHGGGAPRLEVISRDQAHALQRLI